MSAGESSPLRDDAPKRPGRDVPAGIEEREIEDFEEHSRLRVPVMYDVVRREAKPRCAGRRRRCGGPE